LDTLVFTSSRTTESFAQEIGLAPLGQMLSARELLRRPSVTYHHIARLAQHVISATPIAEYSRGDPRGRPDNPDGRPDKTDGRLYNPDGRPDNPEYILPPLAESIAEEVELQVKYESYVRKQE